MKYTIDRIEGNIAVCENDNMEFIEISRDSLPEDAREGSFIEIDESGAVTLADDPERVERIRAKRRMLWRK